MPLDPHVRELLDQLAKSGAPSLETLTVPQARAMFQAMSMPRAEKLALARVEDRRIPSPAGEIPVRVYTPEGQGPFPVLVFFHGGGWVIGNLETHDDICRVLARAVPALVVSVDYRLAPEHPFPAAVEDSYAALCWVAENAAAIGGDPTKLAVGGDSAGGNQAAVVSLLARDRGGPRLAHQLRHRMKADPPAGQEGVAHQLVEVVRHLEARGQFQQPLVEAGAVRAAVAQSARRHPVAG